MKSFVSLTGLRRLGYGYTNGSFDKYYSHAPMKDDSAAKSLT